MIDLKLNRLAHFEAALFHTAGMHKQVAQLFMCVSDAEQRALGAANDTLVADLPAGLAIERRLVQHDRRLVAALEAFYNFATF